MPAKPNVIREREDGILISVHVSPRSSRTAVGGMVDGALRVRLTAPPVDNAANEALVKMLAEFFGLPKSNVAVVSGATSRRKQVLLRGLSMDDVERRLVSA
ncbi:MAG: DUF167 domain-containing protein [Nitrolancea sp.]